MQGKIGEVGRRDLQLAAQLAAVFVRPLSAFDAHAGRLDPFTATEMRAIAAHPQFHIPVNLAVARTLRLADTAFGDEQFARLESDARLRCAVLLVSQELQTVGQAAAVVADAILHRRVLKLTLKPELVRIKEVLGREGYEIATREAPLLYGALGELDSAADPAIFDVNVGASDARRHIVELGLGILTRFVDSAAPALSELMRRRCQSDLDRETRPVAKAPLTDVHCDHVLRLIRRRMPSWSAIIG